MNTHAALSANAEKNKAIKETKKPKTAAIIPKINSGVRLISLTFDSWGNVKLYPQLLQKLASILFNVEHFGHSFDWSLFIFSPQE